MSVGARIREERLRLGLSQPAFAGLAGSTKSALVKWEKDDASPNAKALTVWANAGADVLYILTGRRADSRPGDGTGQIEGRLASIRNDLTHSARYRRPGETEAAADKRVLSFHADELSGFLKNEPAGLTPDLREEVEELLQIATNPAALALYRAADHLQRRNKRREIKEQLSTLLKGGPYLPNEGVGNMLAMLVLDFAVPTNLLAELIDVMHDDIARRNPRSLGMMEAQR